MTMSTMTISLPDGLKAFVDQLVQTEGYGTSSEYLRELIRRDQDKRQFKEQLQMGIRSGIEGSMDAAFFTSLRERANSSRKTS
jgi:antitoxin ParD1/3/4